MKISQGVFIHYSNAIESVHPSCEANSDIHVNPLPERQLHVTNEFRVQINNVIL